MSGFGGSKAGASGVTPWSFEALGFEAPTQRDTESEWRKDRMLGYIGLRVLYEGKVIAKWLNWEITRNEKGGYWANVPSAYYGKDAAGEHIRWDTFSLDDVTAMSLAKDAAREAYKKFTGEEPDVAAPAPGEDKNIPF